MIKVNEIFLSIQGESSFAGLPCVFVRLTGCPLRCSWCDTTYAYYEGVDRKIEDVVDEVLAHEVPLVEVTGGEPLAQPRSSELVRRLCNAGRTVLVETSGAYDISVVDDRARVIMDVKCPSSGMSDRMDWGNMGRVGSTDEVKFVLADREDYEFARDVLDKYRLDDKCGVLISTVFGRLEPRQAIQWMLEDKLAARFQLQVHKLIWAPDERGV